jgi:hypothetical protein
VVLEPVEPNKDPDSSGEEDGEMFGSHVALCPVVVTNWVFSPSPVMVPTFVVVSVAGFVENTSVDDGASGFGFV